MLTCTYNKLLIALLHNSATCLNADRYSFTSPTNPLEIGTPILSKYVLINLTVWKLPSVVISVDNASTRYPMSLLHLISCAVYCVTVTSSSKSAREPAVSTTETLSYKVCKAD